jgi:hypothetical protein
MSGYLQRLVSSAMRPTANVHPVIPPLFSTPEYGTANEDLAEQKPAAPSIASRTFAQFETDVEPRSKHANVEAISETLIPVATTAMHSPREDSSQLHSAQHAAQAPDEQWRKREITSDERAAESRETASSRFAYTPLLPESVGAVSLPQVDPHPATSLTATPQAARDTARRTRSASPNKREPDEIQITIGRIEVTAVPELPALPAAKPGRKQLSLDEYLRRADARGR